MIKAGAESQRIPDSCWWNYNHVHERDSKYNHRIIHVKRDQPPPLKSRLRKLKKSVSHDIQINKKDILRRKESYAMKRKVLVLLVIMIFVLVGCGNNGYSGKYGGKYVSRFYSITNIDLNASSDSYDTKSFNLTIKGSEISFYKDGQLINKGTIDDDDYVTWTEKSDNNSYDIPFIKIMEEDYSQEVMQGDNLTYTSILNADEYNPGDIWLCFGFHNDNYNWDYVLTCEFRKMSDEEIMNG